MLLSRYAADRRGNFSTMLAIAMLPIMGGLALAVDYSEMSRQRQDTLNALDAAGIATARRIDEGVSDAEAKAYAKDFFEANLASVEPSKTTLTVTLPANALGPRRLKLSAGLKYDPYFYPAFAEMLGKQSTSTQMDFEAVSEVQLKNTMEVALVLDNSGSMLELGHGSSEVRFDLLKAAAKQLVDTIATGAAQMKQVNKPVQFGLVPFSAAVNVGPNNASATWMDVDGISPIHHENFNNWSAFPAPKRKVQKVGSIYVKKGTDWGAEENEKVTRFTLFNDLKRYTDESQTETASFASWAGCVESRPYPYNVNDAPASQAAPASLFVPMFAPDETDLTDQYGRPASNNWWYDGVAHGNGNSRHRQEWASKYFTPAPYGTQPMGKGSGPNFSCESKPITPLTDVSKAAGVTAIKNAIDAMEAVGATNVPEGMAWGWRVLSGAAPFTEGRPDAEQGNDKVVIVLTDGANTYYTPESVRAQPYSGALWEWGGNDRADNKAIYSSFGYTGTKYENGDTRLFLGTSNSIGKSDYTNSNYTRAMNEHFAKLCDNAKSSKVIVMTVSLDLDENKPAEKAQMDALKACASSSRYKTDSAGNGVKLFWNATGADLSEKFKEIADELSNLRIVG